MKFHYLLLFLSLNLIAQELSYSQNTIEKKQHYSKIYSVRFLSVPKKVSKEEILRHIPQSLKANTYFMNSGDFITAMYQKRKTDAEILKDLDFVKKVGYKDAYIRVRKVLDNKKVPVTTIQKKPKLSRYKLSELISNANNAYSNGNYMQAIINYEMLLASGNASAQMKQNLCYLYGRTGAFEQAKEIMDHAHYPSQYIYAYAYGSATAGQENYYHNMSPYIALDRTGKLLLLSGYYFEHKGDLQRALAFYKMAYEKNPSNNYNIYAYARVEDISGDRETALKLYKQLLLNVKHNSKLYSYLQQRVQQLGH